MRNHNIIITIDYETWQPIPDGKTIDWEKDIIEPAYELMNACKKSGAKLTFMVEMCEVIWLEEHDSKIYQRIRDQIQDIVKEGHDVQLHMHPNWLPELGAEMIDGRFEWNWDYIHMASYPNDLSLLVKKCKDKLENIVREVDPKYRITAFRAGGYRVQPFERIFEALTNNEIWIDTSVYMGGVSLDRGYDFSKCSYNTKPYIGNESDPSIEAEKGIYELPITCFGDGERLFIDNEESGLLAKRVLGMPVHNFKNETNWLTLIGHTKAEHDYSLLSDQLEILANYCGVNFLTLRDATPDIIASAGKNQKANRSLDEVKEIMEHIYQLVEPLENPNCSWCGNVLLRKKALCYGYVWIVISILHQYGYDVRWITLYAENMPKGRGKKSLDTHEMIEMTLNGHDYLLCPTSKRILYGSIHEFIKNPKKADVDFWGNNPPDSRFIERSYDNYVTSYIFDRLSYYKRTGVPAIQQPGGRKSEVKRRIRNMLTVGLPGMVRHYK